MVKRYGFLRLVNTTAYVLKFIYNLTRKREECITSDVATIANCANAINILILKEQQKLKNNDNFQKLSSLLKLFEDKNNILLLKGRFKNSALNYEEQ